MKVLVIDDQPEALKQIENAISAQKGPDGKSFEVTSEGDHRAAMRRLEDERFDVVVTDMYMARDEDEGLDILRQLTEKSPITIVLTAYASVRNCVESMRAGAWDYLEKVPEDGSNAYENLLASIRQACEERVARLERTRSPADTQWIHENMDALLKEHPGEIVAVLDQKLVDSGKSFSELEKRMKKDFPFARPAIISIPDTRVDSIE